MLLFLLSWSDGNHSVLIMIVKMSHSQDTTFPVDCKSESLRPCPTTTIEKSILLVHCAAKVANVTIVVKNTPTGQSYVKNV